jgi:hypothetical protein
MTQSVAMPNVVMLNVVAPIEIMGRLKKHKFIIKTYKFEWSTREDLLKGRLSTEDLLAVLR